MFCDAGYQTYIVAQVSVVPGAATLALALVIIELKLHRLCQIYTCT